MVTTKKKQKKYTLQDKHITFHACLKNWDKSSKAMESESIVKFVKKAPKNLGCYMQTIVLDYDTITPAHLKEDKGPKSKGQLPKYLAGVQVLADLSHRQKTWRNWYHKMEKGARKYAICAKQEQRIWVQTLDTGYSSQKSQLA